GERVTHHRKKDGSVIDVDVVASSVVVDGRVARLVMATDVTEDRQRERDLVASEKRLRDLIDATTAVIYVKALDGRYLLVNRRYEKLTGFEPGFVEGKTDDELWPASMAEAIKRNDQRCSTPSCPSNSKSAGPIPTHRRPS